MLDGGGDHVPSAVGVPLRDPLEGEVVALGAAGGEDDFLGRHAVVGGDLIARLVDRLAGALSEAVDAGGIAELIGEIGHHRLEHLGIEWRGRRMVEVHHRHHCMARRELILRYDDAGRDGRPRASSLKDPLNAFMYSWTSIISSVLIGPSSAALGRPSGCLAFLSKRTATKLTPQLAQVTSTVQWPSASLSSLTWQSASAWEHARHL